MKRVLYRIFIVAVLFILSAGSVFAFDGGFFDFGAEANGNSPTGLAVGGSLSMGLNLSTNWAVGMKTAFSYAEEVSTLEPCILFRWFTPFGNMIFYAQVELGTAILFEENNSHFTYMGGLAAGLKVPMGKGLYITPVLRVGYPFIWGAGLTFGMAFNSNTPYVSDINENKEIINR